MIISMYSAPTLWQEASRQRHAMLQERKTGDEENLPSVNSGLSREGAVTQLDRERKNAREVMQF